jgi:putative membrane protein
MILDKNIPFRYIFNKIKHDLVIVVFIGLVANLLTIRFHSFLPEMPIGIPTFLGTAISVLLSFKMNQSYDRWWEARKVWGAIVNDSRSLVVQLQALMPAGTGKIRTIAYRQIAWCYSLGQSLRGLDAIAGLENVLQPADLQQLGKHNNKPLAILQLNSNEIKEARAAGEVDAFGHMQLNDTLVRLCDAMGKAERINGTVFPSTYRKFLHFIIYLFVITLSIALKDIDRPFVMLLLFLISISFFLIEKSAYHLQDPFRNRPSDVSVTAIARTIDINIRQLLGEKEVPAPLQPEKFYIL